MERLNAKEVTEGYEVSACGALRRWTFVDMFVHVQENIKQMLRSGQRLAGWPKL